MASLQQLLKRASSAVAAGTLPTGVTRVCLSIGNEAADADSIISALGVAAVLAATAPADVLPVPVASCSRRAGELKPDLALLLEQVELTPADLVYQDEVPWTEWSASGVASVVLTDHNAPEGALAAAGLGDAVVAILDHHLDDGVACPAVTAAAVPEDSKWWAAGLSRAAPALAAAASGSGAGGRAVAFSPSKMKGIGSACTLVAAAWLAACAGGAGAAAADGSAADGGALARLLGLVILLDTNSLKSGKTSAADKAVLAALAAPEGGAALTAALAGVKPGEVAIPAEWAAAATAVRQAKFDPAFWAGMNAQEALEFDLKCRSVPVSGGSLRVAVGTVLTPLPALLAAGAEPLAGVLDAFCAAHDADVAVGMSMTLAPKKARQLLLYTPSEEGLPAVAALSVALEAEGAGLRLTPLPTPDACPSLAPAAAAGRLVTWQQGKLGASRKQVLPLLEAALATVQ